MAIRLKETKKRVTAMFANSSQHQFPNTNEIDLIIQFAAKLCSVIGTDAKT